MRQKGLIFDMIFYPPNERFSQEDAERSFASLRMTGGAGCPELTQNDHAVGAEAPGAASSR